MTLPAIDHAKAPYRADIDGLRAVAVAAVVLFHLEMPGFSGGFAGVDVFFVISGYLITGLLQSAMRQRRFSLAEFYNRRIRRILPALFLVLLCTLPFALWLLLPGEMRDYSQSLAATSLFASNLMFWKEAGYFAARSTYKPLLHTWSLGVEEQFYIFYPLLLWGLTRLVKMRLALALGALALLSFTAAVVCGIHDSNSAFYLPQYRVWELFLGGLLAVRQRAWPPQLTMPMGVCGLALIAASIFGLSAASPIPALGALPATLGAALVIAGGGSDGTGGAARLLSRRPLVFLGKISYSVYLWHWPLISFLSYYRAGPLDLADKLSIAALTFLLALASWKWVEQPARHTRWSRRRVFVAAFAGSALLFGAGLAGHLMYGFPKRFSPDAAEQGMGRNFYHLGTCLVADKTEWRQGPCTMLPAGRHGPLPVVFLWGNSPAAHYVHGLERLQESLPFSLVQMSRIGCAPLPPVTASDTLDEDCDAFNRASLARLLAQKPSLVIIAARWNGIPDGGRIARATDAAVRRLRAAGIVVLLVGEAPYFASDVAMIDRMLRRRGEHSQFYPVQNDFLTDRTLEQIAARYGARFFSLRKYLCNGNVCRISDGRLLQFDTVHMTAHGSDVVVKDMAGDIRAALAQAAANRAHPAAP